MIAVEVGREQEREPKLGEWKLLAEPLHLGELQKGASVRNEAAARDLYVTRHPHAKTWSSFGDFRLFRLEAREIYVVAGFGRMGWVRP